MISLVDGDCYPYVVGHIADTQSFDLDFCHRAIDKALVDIQRKTQADEVRVYLGGVSNFRNRLATIMPYKGNRKKEDRPTHYEACREYLLEKYDASLSEDEEAEDAVSIESMRHDFCDFVIVSADKDLLNTPGLHLRSGKLGFVSKFDAMRNFYAQVVTGDSTDSIPSLYQQLLYHDLPGQADKLKGSKYVKRIKEVLSECDTEYKMLLATWGLYNDFCPHYFTQDFLEVGRLVWMRRKEGELWHYRDSHDDTREEQAGVKKLENLLKGGDIWGQT